MHSNKSRESSNEILYVAFNQDSKCFSVGTETGFRIYNTNPFKLNFERTLGGGIGIVEMLYRCNILALVGGGKNPKFLTNKVIIWDDHQSKVIGELKFSTVVKSVKLKKDKVFIVCEQKIYIFNFESFQDIDIVDTFENPKGIIGLSFDQTITVLAYPDKSKGYVRVKCYENNTTSLINAHENAITYLALNHNGKILATSSERGTIIRIFQSETGLFLQEVRRGKDKADIHYICFDSSSSFIAATSDKGTIHIWTLTSGLKKLKEDEEKEKNVKINEEEETLPQNKTSFLKGLGGFFKSEWSFAQVRITEPRSICTFVNGHSTMVAVSTRGIYYKAEINQTVGGEANITQRENITERENLV